MMDRGPRIARRTVVGVLAIGAAMLVLPGIAEAAPGSQQIAQRIDRIADKVDRIPDIRGLYRKDAAIDRLQSRLHRLERITDHQRGRRARRNGKQIDRLQRRLRKMERRVEARIERRETRRERGRLDWHRHDRHRHDRDWRGRGRDRDHRGPAIVFGWRY